MVESEGSGGPAEGHGGSDLGRGNGAAETGIRHVCWELGRVGGGGARTARIRVVTGGISMLGRRQVKPMW